jgi:signal transduction histidine kinase
VSASADRAGGRSSATRKALIVALAAGGSLTAAILVLDPHGFSLLSVAALTAFMVTAEAIRIDLPYRKAGTVRYTLVESGLTAGLLLMGATEVLVAALLALVFWQAVERIEPFKFAFNVSQYTAGVAAAAGVVLLLAPRPGPVTPMTFGAVALGIALFLLVNTFSVSAMIALTGGRSVAKMARQIVPTGALLAAGNAAIGLVGVLLLQSEPWALPALAVPLVLLYTGSRQQVHARVARERTAAFVDVEQQMSEAASPEGVAELLVQAAAEVLGCHGAVWDGDRWVTPVPEGSGACPVDADLHVALVARGPALGPDVTSACAAIGVGGGVLVAWPDELGISSETEAWLERIGRSGRAGFERVAAHAALEQERATLRAVVDGTGDGILVIDAQTRVRLWNPAVARLSGVGAGHALGYPIDEVLGPGPWGVAGVHDVYRSPDRVWRISVSTVRDRDEGMLHVAVVHDVSAERRVARMKDDMLAVVSHELRTPLTPIKASAQLLRHRWERVSPEQRDELLGQIESRAAHLNRLVEDILLVAQLAPSSRTRPRIAPVQVDYAELLRVSMAHYRSSYPAHELLLDAPDVAPGITDPLRLRQILDNIVDNACKFSPPGSPVTLSLDVDDADVTLRVVDTGRGIPSEDAHRVFERFERVEDPLHMTTSGAGLGLYIARALTQALGGEITIESALGVGTTVVVRLPRGQMLQPSAEGERAVTNAH